MSGPRDLAAEYQAITEKINPTILRAEEVFERVGLRATTTVSLQGGLQLLWAKRDSVWRLYVLAKDGHADLLTTRSRATRLEALEVLPELKRAIEFNMRVSEAEALEIVREAEAWVSDLEERNRR